MSSTAGIAGQEFTSAYAASKFALEGWIESLSPEVAPFGVRTMLVEPGFFPDRPAGEHLDDLGGAVDRRLRRAHPADLSPRGRR